MMSGRNPLTSVRLPDFEKVRQAQNERLEIFLLGCGNHTYMHFLCSAYVPHSNTWRTLLVLKVFRPVGLGDFRTLNLDPSCS
jgi:hypothetical protein